MLTNKELGEYLRKIRKIDRDLSLRQVDYQSGVSYSHLSMIESGTRKPSPLTLKELARVYNLDYIDLLEKAGYIDLAEKEKLKKSTSQDKQLFPILGTVKAGYNYLAQENWTGYINIDRDVSDPENYFALRIIGDSMQPVLYEGDLVIVHSQNDVENGQIGVVIIDGEEATVKKIVKHEDHIELIAFNSYYPPRILKKNDDFKIIGKVIEGRISKIFE